MKKKFLSVVSALIIGASALAAPMSSFAEDTDDVIELQTTNDIFGLSDGLFDYMDFDGDNKGLGAILREYYNYPNSCFITVDYTYDTNSLEILQESKTEVEGAKVVVLSTGLGDYLKAVSDLAEEKYPDDFSEEDPFGSLISIAKKISTSENATAEFTAFIAGLRSSFADTTESALENAKKLCAAVKAYNPDCRIIFTTAYNPVLVSESGLNTLLKGRPALFSTGYTMLRNVFKNSFDEYNEGLKKIKGIEIADVASAFTLASSDGNYGYADVYTDVISSDEHSIYPNALGTVAAANAIIKTIGYSDNYTKNESDEIEDYLLSFYDKYPAAQRKELRSTLGIILGDSDRNNTIDASDASTALSVYSAVQTGSELSSVVDKRLCIALDIDGNGVVDASDASAILAHYADVQSGGNGTLNV